MEDKEIYDNYKFDLWDMIKKNFMILICMIVYVILANIYMDTVNNLNEGIFIFIGSIFYMYVTLRLGMNIINNGNFTPQYKRINKK